MVFRASFLAGAAVAVLLACGTDISKPPVSETGGAGGGGAGGGAATSDGGAPQGSTTDSGLCSGATVSTALVDEQSLSANPPTATGGTIANGTYDLATFTAYVGAGGLATAKDVQLASTIVVNGGTFERVERRIDSSGTTTTPNVSGTIQTAGTSGVIALTCPLPTTEQISYTVNTDSSLVFTDTTTNEARTYRLRQ